MLAERTGLQWLEVSKIAKDNDCLLEYDEELKCHVIDEDKVIHIIFTCSLNLFYSFTLNLL